MGRLNFFFGVVSGVSFDVVTDESTSKSEWLEPREVASLIDRPRVLGTSRPHAANKFLSIMNQVK